MPYAQITLANFIAQLGTNLDDTAGLYWTDAEKTFAVQEGLRVFGAVTSYWRTRGGFSTSPAATYYDLSVVLPTLRTRTWTLQQLTQEIQFTLLEAANGISGAGMSGQVQIQNILQAIQRARNRFVLDSRLPYSAIVAPPGVPPPNGLVQFDQSVIYLHRAAWQDFGSGGTPGAWTNLWREDAWQVDHGSPRWTIEPGSPVQYSEAELAPLQVQLSPAPTNSGALEILGILSKTLDLTDPNETFGIPDEWIHAVKYAALADLFGPNSQIYDPLRAQYCETRYTQALDFAKSARSLLRVMVNGVPLGIDSLAALDAGQPFWRNQSAMPNLAGVLYDILAFSSQVPGSAGVTCDVVQSAPIPIASSDFIPLGEEDLGPLTDYCTHILTIKCGGKELSSTMGDYDNFARACAQRLGITKAKVRMLEPLFGMAGREWQARPDRMEAARS